MSASTRSGGTTGRRQQAGNRRTRAAAARHAQLRAERRRRRLVLGGSGLLALAVVALLSLVVIRASGDRPPTFAAPSDAAAAVRAAGLPLLSTEGNVLHIHAHLDVYVAGRQVAVPAGIGISRNPSGISPLHTHDTGGVVHIESPTERTFTLGQLFAEWQVPLTSRCVGSSCSGVRVYVNGRMVPGQPGSVVFHAHDQIAVVAGKPPGRIPSSYPFPAGE